MNFNQFSFRELKRSKEGKLETFSGQRVTTSLLDTRRIKGNIPNELAYMISRSMISDMINAYEVVKEKERDEAGKLVNMYRAY